MLCALYSPVRRSAIPRYARDRCGTQFVDCRWELGAPGARAASSTSPGTSRAPRSSTSTRTSRTCPCRAPGGIRCPSAERVRRRRLARRDRPGRVRRRLRDDGRRRAALVAAAPLRPRRLRRARSAGSTRGAGRCAAGEEADRAGGRSCRASAPATRSRPDELAAPARRSVARARRRADAEPLARRAEPDRRPAGPHPRRAQRAVGGAAARAAGRASSSRTAAPASPPASCCTAPRSAAAREGSIPGSLERVVGARPAGRAGLARTRA